jgi:hypothetical protein
MLSKKNINKKGRFLNRHIQDGRDNPAPTIQKKIIRKEAGENIECRLLL